MSLIKGILFLSLLYYYLAQSCFAQNLVVNGSFSNGSAGWDSLLVNSPAQASKTISNGVYQIAITTAGTEPWNVQLRQKGIKVDSGAVYTFSFEAYGAKEREIDASVGMENGPYTIYTSANAVRFKI